VPTFVRLAKIGYNIGQYMVENERIPYSKEVVAFFDKNKLNALASYVSTPIALEKTNI